MSMSTACCAATIWSLDTAPTPKFPIFVCFRTRASAGADIVRLSSPAFGAENACAEREDASAAADVAPIFILELIFCTPDAVRTSVSFARKVSNKAPSLASFGRVTVPATFFLARSRRLAETVEGPGVRARQWTSTREGGVGAEPHQQPDQNP